MKTERTSFEHVHHDAGPMTPERRDALRAAFAERERRLPAIGDAAPDFELPVLHGGGARVRLSSLRGRPVALIFGSYT